MLRTFSGCFVLSHSCIGNSVVANIAIRSSGSRAPPAVQLFISYKIQKCHRGPENYAPNQDVNPLLSVTKQECKEVAFDMMKFDGKSGIIALKHRPMYCTSASKQ